MLRISPEQLKQIMPNAPTDAAEAFVTTQGELDGFGITANRNRFAMYLANVAHECGEFRTMTENGNYRANTIVKTWPSRFRSIRQAAPYAHNPAKLFSLVYANRMGNGAPSTGDGFKFRGRGEPMITGKDGYKNVGYVSSLPLLDSPDLASDFATMNRVGGAFWKWKSLDRLADAGDFYAVVGRWNGGHIGMAQRNAYLHRAMEALKDASGGPVPLPPDRPDVPTSDVIPPTVPPIEAASGEPSDKPGRTPTPAFDAEAAQRKLKELGYFPGATDGDEGGLTRDALLSFQADNHLALTGTLDDATWNELAIAGPKHVPESRANATVKTLAEKGSQTITLAANAKKWGVGLFGLGTVEKLFEDGGLVDRVSAIHGKLQAMPWLLDPIKSVWAVVQDNQFLLIGVAGVAVWLVAHEIQKVRVNEERTGANRGR